MFEEAFEEYKKLPKWKGKIFMKDEEMCFKDGAEFGFQKGIKSRINTTTISDCPIIDEWHYVKDGDLPKDNTQVLVFLENKRMKVSIFMENKFTIWNKEYDAYTKLYGVIAWKEIIPPDVEEE